MSSTDAITQASDQALDALREEIVRARKKFPGNDSLWEALAEEIGEAFVAADNRYQSHVTLDSSTRRELIQVACVAIRIVTEGCSTTMDRTVVELARAMEVMARRVLEGE